MHHYRRFNFTMGTPMKKLFLGVTAASFMTATSFAGNLSEPLIQEVEEPEAASSSAPWLALLLLAGVAVFIATQDDNSSTQTVVTTR